MSLALRVFFWPILYVVQLAGVCSTVLLVGKWFEKAGPAPPVLNQYGFGLVGIPLAALAARYNWLAPSGKWIWVPGAFLLVRVVAETDAHSVSEFLASQLSDENPVGVAINILVFASVVYSVTLAAIEVHLRRVR